jgi:AraC family transcriptional regulator
MEIGQRRSHATFEVTPLNVPGPALVAASDHACLSTEREWNRISAEVRNYRAGEASPTSPSCTEVAMLIRGRCAVRVDRTSDCGDAAVTRGTLWLRASDASPDLRPTFHELSEVLHLYLPADPFSLLGADDTCAGSSRARLSCRFGFHDLLIERICECVLAEMRRNTPCGRVLIESLARGLAARLLQGYSTAASARFDVRSAHGRLGHGRLEQVLEFVETHIGELITVEQLATLACLSQFHFAREFKAATGRSPYQHVTERRLSRAKALLSEGDRSLSDIAIACGFSSQGNFWRVFRRATGVTPGRFRAEQLRPVDSPSGSASSAA